MLTVWQLMPVMPVSRKFSQGVLKYKGSICAIVSSKLQEDLWLRIAPGSLCSRQQLTQKLTAGQSVLSKCQ